MFPILSILAAPPGRFIGASVLAAVVLAGGCQFGTNRVTVKWGRRKGRHVTGRRQTSGARACPHYPSVHHQSGDFE